MNVYVRINSSSCKPPARIADAKRIGENTRLIHDDRIEVDINCDVVGHRAENVTGASDSWSGRQRQIGGDEGACARNGIRGVDAPCARHGRERCGMGASSGEEGKGAQEKWGECNPVAERVVGRCEKFSHG